MEQYFNEFENSGEKTTADQDTSQKSDKDKFEDEILAALKQKTETLYDEVSGLASNKKIEDVININMDEEFQYVRISMNGAILFDSGSDEIKRSALDILSKVGDILKIYDAHQIKIEGHTDNVPISSGKFEDNMWLSTARATRVWQYFVNEKKLEPKTLEAAGRQRIFGGAARYVPRDKR